MARERALLHAVLRLMGAGHSTVWDYGWAFFRQGLEVVYQEQEQARRLRLHDMAYAMRAALLMDEKGFAAFLEGKA